MRQSLYNKRSQSTHWRQTVAILKPNGNKILSCIFCRTYFHWTAGNLDFIIYFDLFWEWFFQFIYSVKCSFSREDKCIAKVAKVDFTHNLFFKYCNLFDITFEIVNLIMHFSTNLKSSSNDQMFYISFKKIHHNQYYQNNLHVKITWFMHSFSMIFLWITVLSYRRKWTITFNTI